MTTGMRPDQTTTSYERRERRNNWIWGIVALILAAGLVAIAVYSSKHTGTNNAAPNATTGAVQSSSSGQQGAVGNYAEQVVPNSNQNNQGNNTGNNANNNNVMPPAATNVNTPPNAKAVPANSATSSNGEGAGNTGITTATDSVGGASTKQMQGQGTTPSTQNPGNTENNR